MHAHAGGEQASISDSESSDCSGVGGGLGALLAVLVILLIAAVLVAVYLYIRLRKTDKNTKSSTLGALTTSPQPPGDPIHQRREQ